MAVWLCSITNMHAMLPASLAESTVLVCSQATEATAGDFLCAQEVKLQLDVGVLSCLLQALLMYISCQ